MEEPANNNLSGAACFVFALAVIAGVALAWAISPALFRALPTDMSRIQVILQTLDDESAQPEIVLFGTSVGMASVDTRKISAALPGNPLAYNFSSTGQTPIEGYMYYQELPEQTGVILQMLNPATLQSAEVLNAQKYNAFYMYGYRPDERTIERSSSLLGEDMAALFGRSDFGQRFDSRWAARQMADRFARGLMRTDLTLDRGTYDLYYPSSYTVPLPAAQMERALYEKYGRETRGKIRTSAAKIDFLGEVNDRARDSGRQLVFILSPLHPAHYEYRGEDFTRSGQAAMQAFAAENDAIIIDGTDIIPGDQYVDAVHPTEAGAAVFTEWLISELQRLEAEGRLTL